MCNVRNRDINMAEQIAHLVKKNGGRTFYVGGFVRDRLLGKENKDVDIEVHGLESCQLEKILDALGERVTIGENFGIFGIKGYSLDIALPRKEHLRGLGHKDFDIFVDPDIGVEKAARRRDFTINAMMQDVLSGEIIDCYGGKRDLEKRIIRHVDDASFIEDPLRVLRAAQFAARFGFGIAEETLDICKKLTLKYLPKERVMVELEKALLKSEQPSIFFEALKKMKQLDEWFPELSALIGIDLDSKYHLDGDVWQHTMMVLDQAVKYRDDVDNAVAFMISALTHDIGKSICTKVVNGEIQSYNHEIVGVPLAEQFVKRLTNEITIKKYVLNLTEMHMQPAMFLAKQSSIEATNKMFDQAIDAKALIYLSEANYLGEESSRDNVLDKQFLQKRLYVFEEYMSRPYVNGKDLIQSGLKPCKEFSEYLNFAHKLRLAGVEKEDALKQTLAYVRKSN